MEAPNLCACAPRRWSAEIAGVRWLARLADKARAAHNGSLGTYLYGHSPMDRSLLRALGCTHDEFARVAVAARDDTALASALQSYDPDLRRAREWSAQLPKRFGWFLAVLDIDDGYRTFPLHGVVRMTANAISRLVKRTVPSAFHSGENDAS
jgi:hypothetical protein